VSRDAIRALLARRGLAAHRERGQNFLVDEDVADRIAALAALEGAPGAIEIGAGLGLLTRALARRTPRVVAIEVDAGLVRALREEGGLPPSVELLHADALRVDLRACAERLGPGARAVGNLPYAISSPLLRRLLDLRDVLSGWLVMVQREVALRITASPGTRDYGSLAVLHRLVAATERVGDLPPSCFFPRPRVVSSLVRVTPLANPPLAPDELPWLERWLRAAFGSRRKMLANTLRAAPGSPGREAVHGALDALGIDRRIRAEALPPATLLAVARSLRGSTPCDPA
jgi:16S rRNA (adenine1518-N6/adenine1519-N6)-dimethyltransferase